MSRRDEFIQVAQTVPYDDTIQTPLSGTDNTQDIIDWIKNRINTSASPGFTWGRSGNISSNTWLLNDSVPSNKAGRTVVLNSAKIVKLFTASEDLDTYTLQIYYHDGNEINLTLVTTLTVTASRTGDSGTISISVPNGKQLAAKLNTGSAKNLIVGIIMQGTT